MDPLNILAKFEVRIALRVPEITGGTPKIWAVPGIDTPTLHFLQNF